MDSTPAVDVTGRQPARRPRALSKAQEKRLAIIRRQQAKVQARFLAALAERGSITDAAAAAGISRGQIYNWRDANPAFAEALEVAIEHGTDRLEDFARNRAYESDKVLIFLLKKLRPHKFGDKVGQLPLGALPGRSLEVTTTVRVDSYTDEELELAKQLLLKAGVDPTQLATAASIDVPATPAGGGDTK